MRAALAIVALLGAADAAACDIAFPPGVDFQTKEKARGWSVRTIKPEAGAEGFLLFAYDRRRALPDAREEKRFLETHIARGVGDLYHRKPTRVALDAPSRPDAERADMRAFTLSILFGDDAYSALGYFMPNKRRGDIAVVVALPAPGDEARAAELARLTAIHPGFDCDPGDSP